MNYMAYQIAHLIVGKLNNLFCSTYGCLNTAPLNEYRMDNNSQCCIWCWSYHWNNCFAIYLCTHLHSTKGCLHHVR